MATATSYCVRFRVASDSASQRARDGQIGAAQSEVERLPSDKGAERAAPSGAEIVGAEHRAGDRGDHALRQQKAEDVVAGGAIDLRERVDAGQVGGAGQLNAGRGGIDLLLRNADGRIVAERALDGLADRQRLRCGGLADVLLTEGEPATARAKNREQKERLPVLTPLFAFHEFSKQLAYLDLGGFQRLPSEGGRAVDLAQRLAVALFAWIAGSPSSPSP